jgi:hypothetical protein
MVDVGREPVNASFIHKGTKSFTLLFYAVCGVLSLKLSLRDRIIKHGTLLSVGTKWTYMTCDWDASICTCIMYICDNHNGD